MSFADRVVAVYLYHPTSATRDFKGKEKNCRINIGNECCFTHEWWWVNSLDRLEIVSLSWRQKYQNSWKNSSFWCKSQRAPHERWHFKRKTYLNKWFCRWRKYFWSETAEIVRKFSRRCESHASGWRLIGGWNMWSCSINCLIAN